MVHEVTFDVHGSTAGEIEAEVFRMVRDYSGETHGFVTPVILAEPEIVKLTGEVSGWRARVRVELVQ